GAWRARAGDRRDDAARGGRSARAHATAGHAGRRVHGPYRRCGGLPGGGRGMSVVLSEWTKLRTLRSTLWSPAVAVRAMGGLGSISAVVQMARWSQLEPQERLRYDAIDVGVGGFRLAQLAVGVLGVLVISGEYSTGMIRSSLMAVPRRLPVLWAK